MNAPEKIAADAQARWMAAFGQDFAALAALYEPRAFLFGSKRDLFHTREEVRAYFEGFPAGMLRKARCYDQHAHALGHDVIITAGYVIFTVFKDGVEQDLDYRISFTLVKRGDTWMIASHHASPRVETL